MRFLSTPAEEGILCRFYLRRTEKTIGTIHYDGQASEKNVSEVKQTGGKKS